MPEKYRTGLCEKTPDSSCYFAGESLKLARRLALKVDEADAFQEKWRMQLFFTTKPTGQGTGLGPSLAYDIITKGHSGELKVKTKEAVVEEFVIVLPAA